MSSNAWSWLPDGALSSPGVLTLVDEAVAAWSGRWFRDHRLVRRRLEFADAPAAQPAVASATGLSVRATPAAVEVLAGHALDADLSRLEKSESDQLIIETLSQSLLSDLAATLATVLATDKAFSAADASGGVMIELTDEDGRKALIIETSRAVLAAACLGGLAERRARRGPPLVPIRTAAADIPVTLSAEIGTASISLPEARRLAVGDVIVLDRSLDQPINLVPASGGGAVACARLVDTASPPSLRLEAAVKGDRR